MCVVCSTLICLFVHKRKGLDSHFFPYHSFYFHFRHLFVVILYNVRRRKICQKRVQIKVTKHDVHFIIITDKNTIALDSWKLHGNMLVIVFHQRIHFSKTHLRDNINRRSRMQWKSFFSIEKVRRVFFNGIKQIIYQNAQKSL